ncbi:hypothetical protein [Bacillus massilinigeriensis]|uniref:hypothetical protein n=1 Tax=Bacillus massilionigeriensis TaxID=1805475 RepID=UPI00096B5DE8|nr:hypothetical protein [Bacillus massilionigeriensis]
MAQSKHSISDYWRNKISQEEEMGLTKNEFLELASDDIYQNNFLKRKVTGILTNRLNVAF